MQYSAILASEDEAPELGAGLRTKMALGDRHHARSRPDREGVGAHLTPGAADAA